MNETHVVWNITFSFFPLFGILVIHLASVNGKHRRDKHSFAATKVDRLWTSILCSSLQSNRKLFVDWSIFSVAFILSRGLCFDESAGISSSALCSKFSPTRLVILSNFCGFLSKKFLTSAAVSRTHFLYHVLKKFDFSSTSRSSGLFLPFLTVLFIYFYFLFISCPFDIRSCGIA